MLIKICGLNNAENIMDLSQFHVDLYGFIFVPNSNRNALLLNKSDIQQIPEEKRVAVFVNKPIADIQEICKHLKFQIVQLHGSESPEDCQVLKDLGFLVFKAFSISENFNFNALKNYEGVADYFLFDTAGKHAGGNGFSFDWEILKNYTGNVPFLLSGGLGTHNLHEIIQYNHPKLVGYDFNSRLENYPGFKNLNMCETVTKKLKNYAAR